MRRAVCSMTRRAKRSDEKTNASGRTRRQLQTHTRDDTRGTSHPHELPASPSAVVSRWRRWSSSAAEAQNAVCRLLPSPAHRAARRGARHRVPWSPASTCALTSAGPCLVLRLRWFERRLSRLPLPVPVPLGRSHRRNSATGRPQRTEHHQRTTRTPHTAPRAPTRQSTLGIACKPVPNSDLSLRQFRDQFRQFARGLRNSRAIKSTDQV